MRSQSLLSFVIAAVLSISPALVKANTPLDDAYVQNDLTSNNGLEIAYASRPLWHFGKSWGNKPCYPSAALSPEGQQWGVDPSGFDHLWPNAGAGCPDPGPDGWSNPFPTYFTVSSCNQEEIRVAYHIYFKKDGFAAGGIAKGHMHDWERIIVTWRKDTNTNQWTRAHLLKSYHTGYMEDNWDGIQNTFNEDNAAEQDGKNKDHPKIYVGWGKHAIFSTRNTGWNDVTSQGCGREFRSGDWFYIPKKEDLLPSGKGSTEGEKLRAFDWGSANNGPLVVEEKVCTLQNGGYIPC